MRENRRISSGKVRAALCAAVVAGIASAGALASISSLGATAAGSSRLQTRKSTDPPLRPKGKLGQDLFLALDHRDLQGVEALLNKGADPNSRNGLEFTPLFIAAASHQTDAMKVLLKAGAKPEAGSTYGTPLTFAAASGNVDGVKLLLSLGVKADGLRSDGMTPLMMGAISGATPIVNDLLMRKLDVNVQDDGGETALSLAARLGHTEIGTILIAAGANVNTADADGETPLMGAALTGHADFASMLLGKGAKPDAKDRSGRTALVLAASYGDYPDVIRTLVDANADTELKDAKGRTALKFARERGYSETVAVLDGHSPVTGEIRLPRSPREAVNLSLKRIQASMLEFNRSTTCVSCHQEGLGRIATGEAKTRGFQMDPEAQGAQMGRINGMLTAMRPLHEQALKDPETMKLLPLIEINEVTTLDAWLLVGMAAQSQPPNESTAAMALVLARQQAPNGCWTFSVPRVPMQSSFFTFTALAVRALEVYGPKSHEADIAQRIGKAKEWLLAEKPQSGEDRASRLLALKWTRADASACKGQVADILADQRPDGGWAQSPDRHSDAYATGQALYALHVGGGVPAQDPAYKHGEKFLLQTQDDDGTWFVNKWAMPANNYFDSGFPHGESQYASFNGTCWATLALLASVEGSK